MKSVIGPFVLAIVLAARRRRLLDRRPRRAAAGRRPPAAGDAAVRRGRQRRTRRVEASLGLGAPACRRSATSRGADARNEHATARLLALRLRRRSRRSATPAARSPKPIRRSCCSPRTPRSARPRHAADRAETRSPPRHGRQDLRRGAEDAARGTADAAYNYEFVVALSARSRIAQRASDAGVESRRRQNGAEGGGRTTTSDLPSGPTLHGAPGRAADGDRHEPVQDRDPEARRRAQGRPRRGQGRAEDPEGLALRLAELRTDSGEAQRVRR